MRMLEGTRRRKGRKTGKKRESTSDKRKRVSRQVTMKLPKGEFYTYSYCLNRQNFFFFFIYIYILFSRITAVCVCGVGSLVKFILCWFHSLDAQTFVHVRIISVSIHSQFILPLNKHVIPPKLMLQIPIVKVVGIVKLNLQLV